MSDSTKKDLVPIPQPAGLPLVGNMFDIDPYYAYGWQEKLAAVYGEIYSLQFGGPRRVIVNSFELANECFDEKRYRL